MRKVVVRCVLAVMVMAGASVALAPAGGAATDDSPRTDAGIQARGDCWSGKLCFWTSSGYMGSLFMYPHYGKGQCHTMTSSINNNAGSMWNRSGGGLYVYKGANCTGESRHVNNNSYHDFGPGHWNDAISSFKFTS